MPSEVKAFKCDWCPRCFGRKNNAAQHEEHCRNNPARRNCITCVHGLWAEVEIVPDPCDYDQPMDVYGPYCGYHDKPIMERPYFIECEMHQDGYGEDYPMPGTCDHYEYKGKAEWTEEAADD